MDLDNAIYIESKTGKNVGRHRVRRLMQKMGIQAIYQKPKTSLPNQKHKIYPYLLKNLTIDSPIKFGAVILPTSL